MVAGDCGEQAAGPGSVLGKNGLSSGGEGRSVGERARGDRASAARAGHAVPVGTASCGPRKPGAGAGGGQRGGWGGVGGAGTERELAGGSGAGDGGGDGERLASVEGAAAELDSAGALLEGQFVPGLRWIEDLALEFQRTFVFASGGDQGVENAFQGGGGT